MIEVQGGSHRSDKLFCWCSRQGSKGHKQVTVSEKKLRVAINGFGRIGRNFLRCWHGRENSLLDVVVLNDSGGVKQAAHLLKYDSTLGENPR